MGIGPHDDGNSIADSLGYQNNRVPKFDTERNVAVPKIVDTNVRQIGYLGAAGQFFVMAVQMNYGEPSRGMPGLLYDRANYDAVTRRNSAEDGKLFFGCGVVQGAEPGKDITLPATGATAEKFEGVVMYSANTPILCARRSRMSFWILNASTRLVHLNASRMGFFGRKNANAFRFLLNWSPRARQSTPPG